MRRLVPSILAFAAACAASHAATVDRVIRRFDFEERAAGNLEDVPMNWVKIEGPGMPHYVNGRLATDEACSGRYAFRFDLDGGSLVYRYPAGRIAAHPAAQYALRVMAKTQDVVNARAQLTAYFVDAAKRPIKSTVVRSTPSASAEWTPLTADLVAPDGAAWLVIELGLVQPSLWRAAAADSPTLLEQDITGHCWFDDLTVTQVPQLTLECDAPGHVFRRSSPVVLNIGVTDRLTADLSGRLVVTDADGHAVYQRSGAMDLSPAATGAAQTARLDLPPLPAGWYQATVAFTSGGNDVGSRGVDFVQLADEGAAVEPDLRLGIAATRLPFAAWKDLPAVLPFLAASRVKLAVWDESGDVEHAPGLDFDGLLGRLDRQRIGVTGCFAAVPPLTAAAVGGPTWGDLARAPVERWQPPLALMVSRYAGHIDRWQFGRDDQAEAFTHDAGLQQAYAAFMKPMSEMFGVPDLAMPWPAWFDVQKGTPQALALSVSTDVMPQQLPEYVKDLQRSGRPQVALSLQTLSLDRYGRPAQVRDLAQRVGYALSSGATRIEAPLPFAGDGPDTLKRPQEAFLILRTLLSTLAHTTYKGRMPLDPDVDALLFDRDGEGVLLMWTKAPQASAKTVPVVLGESPRSVDLYGNTSPVLKPKGPNGTTEVTVGPTPSLLIGIDGPLAQLRTSFAFDNPLVESSFKPHVRRLKFTNPYAGPISGRLKLSGPAGWSITVQDPAFSVPAGQSYDGPVTIEFPYSSVAGVKPIDCEVHIEGDHAATFKVPMSLRLGLGELGVETSAFRDGADVVVQQMITNYGQSPANYTAFATYPGTARQERMVDALPPGASVIKKYRFTNAGGVGPQHVRTGVRETEGTRVLNDDVTVQ